MSAVGWVIATGSLTFANRIANDAADQKTMSPAIDWVTIPIATGGAAVAISFLSKASEPLANMLAVIAFITVAVAPIAGRKSPAENLLRIFKERGIVA